MKRIIVATVSVAALVLGMAGCANPEIESEGQQTEAADIVASVEKNDEIAALLPEEFADGFTISINTDVEPIKFVDSDGNIAGLNPDLLRAAARVLGTEAEFEEGTFDGLMPGLEAKRFDVIASVADFVERQTYIDFIDYMRNGTAIITNVDFEKDEITREDFCGLSIGYARGTSQQASLEEIAAECVASGSPELEINGYNDTGAGILSVKSGEADAFWGDFPQMAYNVKKTPDTFKIVYEEQKSILGIGIHKDNAELRDALQAALLQLVEDGTYDALMEKWGLSDSALPEMDINSDISMEG
ncbi:ABC transporter substrate-binding protein [Microbacterium sp. SD291]|uniref:ABC transporter substrate-binding protein n=1 Tax=Microbacterium sp. SD291 TaxID=2782007 RepID=UPI001A961311|nr:ABC transporter substrate-binding protein [Microbacterium sp. SD291]MBO0982144.1 ABC transporter substrate-binding protein [Microbacterium sp. SD291]